MTRDEQLAAEFVIGTLNVVERAEVRTRMALDGAFAARVHAWEQAFAPLYELVTPIAPPPALGRVIAEDAEAARYGRKGQEAAATSEEAAAAPPSADGARRRGGALGAPFRAVSKLVRGRRALPAEDLPAAAPASPAQDSGPADSAPEPPAADAERGLSRADSRAPEAPALARPLVSASSPARDADSAPESPEAAEQELSRGDIGVSKGSADSLQLRPSPVPDTGPAGSGRGLSHGDSEAPEDPARIRPRVPAFSAAPAAGSAPHSPLAGAGESKGSAGFRESAPFSVRDAGFADSVPGSAVADAGESTGAAGSLPPAPFSVRDSGPADPAPEPPAAADAGRGLPRLKSGAREGSARAVGSAGSAPGLSRVETEGGDGSAEARPQMASDARPFARMDDVTERGASEASRGVDVPARAEGVAGPAVAPAETHPVTPETGEPVSGGDSQDGAPRWVPAWPKLAEARAKPYIAEAAGARTRGGSGKSRTSEPDHAQGPKGSARVAARAGGRAGTASDAEPAASAASPQPLGTGDRPKAGAATAEGGGAKSAGPAQHGPSAGRPGRAAPGAPTTTGVSATAPAPKAGTAAGGEVTSERPAQASSSALRQAPEAGAAPVSARVSGTVDAPKAETVRPSEGLPAGTAPAGLGAPASTPGSADALKPPQVLKPDPAPEPPVAPKPESLTAEAEKPGAPAVADRKSGAAATAEPKPAPKPPVASKPASTPKSASKPAATSKPAVVSKPTTAGAVPLGKDGEGAGQGAQSAPRRALRRVLSEDTPASRRVRLLWAGGVLAAVLAIAVGGDLLARWRGDGAPQPRAVVLEPVYVANPPPDIQMRFDARSGRAELRVSAPPAPEGRIYRLRLVTEKTGTHLLGTFTSSFTVVADFGQLLSGSAPGAARLTVTLDALDDPGATGEEIYNGRISG